MPYTNAWTNLHPLGTDAANEIEKYIQRVRLDVAERMADLVVDWTADPVVLAVAGSVRRFKRVSYNTSAAAGSRASSYADMAALLNIVLVGVTNSSGQITIDLDEVNTASGGSEVWSVNAGGVALWSGYRASDGVPVFMRVIATSVADNTQTLQFQYGDGAVVASLTIAGTLLFLSQADPEPPAP